MLGKVDGEILSLRDAYVDTATKTVPLRQFDRIGLDVRLDECMADARGGDGLLQQGVDDDWRRGFAVLLVTSRPRCDKSHVHCGLLMAYGR